MFAVAAITRSIERRRGWPPRLLTAADSRLHSRAISTVIGNGSNADSIAPSRSVRSARSSSSLVTRTPKWSSAIEATLIAAWTCEGGSSPISTEVSRTARIRYSNGLTIEAGNRSRSAPSVFGAGPCQTARNAGPLTHRLCMAGPSCATGRPATVIVISSPASARRSTSPTLLRSSFCGMVAIGPMVAELLPWACHLPAHHGSVPTVSGERRLLQQSLFVNANCQARLADDIAQLSNDLQRGLLRSIDGR